VVRLEVCLLAEAAHAFLELSGFKASLTSAELSAFRERVRAELVPNLADVRRTWQSNRSSDQHADEHMKPLLESFSALKEEFVDDPAILGNIDHEIKLAREWIAEMDDEPKEDRPARTSTTLTSKPSLIAER
jgi:hypothetical protein